MIVKKIFILTIFLFTLAYAGEKIYPVDRVEGSFCPPIEIPPYKEISKDIISTSLLIISVEVSVLAVVYALGKVFSHEKLITYSRGELTQALANIILIAVIFAFFSIINTYDTIKSLQSQLSDIRCSGYKYALPMFVWNAIASLFAEFELNQVKVDIPIPVAPAVWIKIILGVNKIQFVEGVSPFLDVIDRLFGFFSGGYLFFFATQIFLNFIIEMFPTLLYLGLLLRVIPWTRSAGGYLIAFFITFYFFYPILLQYLFSIEEFKTIEYGVTLPNAGTINPSDTLQVLQSIGVFPPQVTGLEYFTIDFVNLAIRFILPILLCFIMSLMLVEEIASILGSYMTRVTLFKLI
jgi:hypothetical protein